MTTYIDASVLLRRVLPEEGQLAQWAAIVGGVTSAITRVECLRALDRRRRTGRLDDHGVAMARTAILTHVNGLAIIRLSSTILERASQPLPTALGTLDAIHLATALQWREVHRQAITMATHDRRLGECAMALGLEVIGIAG